MSKKSLIVLIIVLGVFLVGGLIATVCLSDALEPTEPVLQTDPTQPSMPTQPSEPALPTQPITDPTEEPTQPTEPRPEIFTLTFTGDCTLGTEEGWHDYYRNFIRLIGEDYDHPFRPLPTISAMTIVLLSIWKAFWQKPVWVLLRTSCSVSVALWLTPRS